MSRRPNKPDPNRQPEHPLFIVDVDSERSKGYCTSCFGYQQDIGILQQKLLQTHHKLIKQIDVSREQQERIIELVRQKDQNEASFGLRRKDIQAEDFQNVEYLIEQKTQLLRHDLEAMRTKVLSEINKSNKLREQNKQLELRHERDTKQINDKVKRLEILRNKLMQENERMMLEIEEFREGGKQSQRCLCGFEEKYFELDVVFNKQRAVANQLIQENNRLQNKLQELQEEINVNTQYINRKQEMRTQPKRRKMQKIRHEFEETKSLIKKMEQAQHTMRARNR